jgi:hypothetical protein
MAEFSTVTETGGDRGQCKACHHWQAEHDGPDAEEMTIGLCMHPELTHFSLEVAGHCGCNRYTAAKKANAELATADR